MNATAPMPRRIAQLFLWFCIGYFLIIYLRELTLVNSIEDEFSKFSDLHMLTLKIGGLIAFFSYTLSQYLLFYYGFDRLRWNILAAAEVVLVLACMFFRAFLEEGVVKGLTGTGNYNPDMLWSTYLIDNIYYAVVFSSVGIIFFFFQLARYNQAARLDSELLQRETELKFLRSQVNPHFLFNTLNNLYSLVNAKSDQSLPALEKLSGLLRYSLYEQEPTVPLEREVSYLRDLVHLESLRIPNLAPPEVTIGPFEKEWTLPPLLLVPFVENAFKHGKLTNLDNPLTINISESTGQLKARITNPIRQQRTSIDGVGGIGLKNVRKRLELLYPEMHSLKITSEDGVFVVEMRLYGERLLKPSSSTKEEADDQSVRWRSLAPFKRVPGNREAH